MNRNKKMIQVGPEDDISKYDTFHSIFPKEDEYLELALCMDSKIYLKSFLDRLDNVKNVLESVQDFKSGIGKLLFTICKFIKNELPGKIRNDKPVGKILEYRQDMVAKIGILDMILSGFLKKLMDADQEEEVYVDFLKFDDTFNNEFDGLLEMMFECSNLIVASNFDNLKTCIKHIDILNFFEFIPNCTRLLVTTFKDKNFRLNKKEIHSELLYRRIFEISRFEKTITHFVEKLEYELDKDSLYILRKMCIIEGNPMILVQRQLLEKLYFEEEYVLKYTFSTLNDGVHIIDSETKEAVCHISDFDTINPKIKSIMLEKVTLEADMCFGRNKKCKAYFKEVYPVDWLITIIIDPSINYDLRARFIRLFTFIYVDDPPHKLVKLSRTTKAYESADKYIKETSELFQNNISSADTKRLFDFINEYMESYLVSVKSASQIRSFELEMIRCCYYMLRFGLYTYRDGQFQIQDIDKLFSFLCIILDLMTKKGYNKSIHILDDIINREAVLESITNQNPIERVAHDIKYSLFNRNFSSLEEEHNLVRDKMYADRSMKKFRVKITVQITLIFHFLNDLRQNYLISNNVELFYQKVYWEYHTRIDEKIPVMLPQKMYRSISKEFKYMVPESPEFKNLISYNFPSIDMMYDNEEFLNANKNETVFNEMHDEFVTLMVDTFNLHRDDLYLQQLILSLISRYNSETAEFVRNIDRTLLLLDRNDYMFFTWIHQALEDFVELSEKAHRWIKSDSIAESTETEIIPTFLDEIKLLNKLLKEFRRSIVYKTNVQFNNETKEFELSHTKGERKINKFVQALFRNEKVYDYLLNFLYQNKQLLISCRLKKFGQDLKLSDEKIHEINKVFHKIFMVLLEMTRSNTRSQELMWKYKQFFVFKDLGDSPQDGELDLVLCILENKD